MATCASPTEGWPDYSNSSAVDIPLKRKNTRSTEILPPPLPEKPPSFKQTYCDKIPEQDQSSTSPLKLRSKLPPQATSKAYNLEEFYQRFDFPQLVRVVDGYYGVYTEEYTMSEDQELLLFFIKTSRVVHASSERSSAWYYIPLNSSLQFVPYTHTSGSNISIKGNYLYHHYKTVKNLIKRKVLPKVMKVCKSYKGKTAESSVVEGELLFPQRLSVTLKGKTVVECLNSKGRLLSLPGACEGNFSTDPMDVKLPLSDLLRFFKDFPISVMVINEQAENSKLSILTGTVLTLQEPKPVQSYICSTDVFGEMDYPLMEMPISMPIKIQCIHYPDLNMKPIFDRIRETYENFKPSLVSKSIFPAESSSEFTAQQELYEEVRMADGSIHIYDLERPNNIYNSIPISSQQVVNVDYYVPPRNKPASLPPTIPPKKNKIPSVEPKIEVPLNSNAIPILQKELSSSPGDEIPTLPPMESAPLLPPMESAPTLPPRKSAPLLPPRKSAPLLPPRKSAPLLPPRKSAPLLPPRKSAPLLPPRERASSFPQTKSQILLSSSSPTKDVSLLPPVDETPDADGYGALTKSVSSEVGSSNRSYLKSLNLLEVLQMLENMNLSKYREGFADQQIDGEVLVHLKRADLADLGVNKNIHQTRLLKLIDGSLSAKKFVCKPEDWYASPKTLQSTV